jgi:predicted transcriptional regulator
VREVAEEVGLTRKSVYRLVREEGLPVNAPVQEGGPREAQIFKMVVCGFRVATVGEMFSLAPGRVREVVERVKERTRAEAVDCPG